MPRGGFYITGGLAPKNLDFFTQSDIFLNAVFDKGRVSDAVKSVPIYLVLTEDIGERGAHYYAYALLQNYKCKHLLHAKPLCSALNPETEAKLLLYGAAVSLCAAVGCCALLLRKR